MRTPFDASAAAAPPLAEMFAALASPARLALLLELAAPKALSEIRLRAREPRGAGLAPGRLLARQSVRHHLDGLLAAGFVRSVPRPRGELPGEDYVVDRERLFLLSEEVRRLASLLPRAPIAARSASGSAARPGAVPSPSLVIVHGLGEGRAFPLEALGGDSAVVIGRREGAGVALDHDPFIAPEHARLTRDADGRWRIEDLAGGDGATSVNWAPVASGERAAIAHGDVLGVGRTLLLFRT